MRSRQRITRHLACTCPARRPAPQAPAPAARGSPLRCARPRPPALQRPWARPGARQRGRSRRWAKLLRQPPARRRANADLGGHCRRSPALAPRLAGLAVPRTSHLEGLGWRPVEGPARALGPRRWTWQPPRRSQGRTLHTASAPRAALPRAHPPAQAPRCALRERPGPPAQRAPLPRRPWWHAHAWGWCARPQPPRVACWRVTPHAGPRRQRPAPARPDRACGARAAARHWRQAARPGLPRPLRL